MESQLQDYLTMQIEPGQESFVQWLEGLGQFGQRTRVVAAIAMSSLVLSDSDGDDSITGPLGSAIKTAKEWLLNPSEENRKRCKKAANIASSAAKIAQARTDRSAKKAKVAYDEYGDNLGGVFRDSADAWNYDEAKAYCRRANIARWTAEVAAAKTQKECKKAIENVAESTLFSSLLSGEVREVICKFLAK